MSLFDEGLNEQICDNMRVYLGKYPRTPLTELGWYADTSIKIANQSVCSSGKALKYRTARVFLRPWKLPSYNVIGDDVSGNTSNASNVTPETYDNCRRTATTLASDKILYCWVCQENTQTLIQGPYVKVSVDLLQKRKKNLKEFDRTVRPSHSYYRRGRGKFRGRRNYNLRWIAREDAQVSEAAIEQSSPGADRGPKLQKSINGEERGVTTVRFHQQPNWAVKIDNGAVHIGAQQGFKTSSLSSEGQILAKRVMFALVAMRKEPSEVKYSRGFVPPFQVL